MRKQHGSIEEFKGRLDLTKLIKAGDMEREGSKDFPLMMHLLWIFSGWLLLLSIGIIVYKLAFARSSNSLWINIPFGVAILCLGWFLLRWEIRRIIRIRSSVNPGYEWRPGGNHATMIGEERQEEGVIEFACPHCNIKKHSFRVLLYRIEASVVTYIPAFFDPLFAERLQYNRVFRVPLTCPVTSLQFEGLFFVKQSSYNPVVGLEVVGPAS